MSICFVSFCLPFCFFNQIFKLLIHYLSSFHTSSLSAAKLGHQLCLQFSLLISLCSLWLSQHSILSNQPSTPRPLFILSFIVSPIQSLTCYMQLFGSPCQALAWISQFNGHMQFLNRRSYMQYMKLISA